jgi:hypothetical protein
MLLSYTQDQTPTEESNEDVLFYFQTEGWIYSIQEKRGYWTEDDV